MDASLTFKTALAAVLCAACCAAPAQDLPDPTRPPAAAMPAAAQGGAVAAVPIGPVLQSVLIGNGRNGRRVAVISGQSVQVGDRVGEATVVQISNNQVVLRTQAGRQVLRLFSDGARDANYP